MQNKPLKLGDLVKPDKLKKPGSNVEKVELGASPEKIKQLEGGMSDLSATVEGDKDVRAGEVTALVEATKKALVKELAPEVAQELLAELKERFFQKDKHYSANDEHIKAMAGIRWEDVQKKLEANPEKLWSLNEMEWTGGEPDLFGIDEKTGEYIFMDFSVESPIGRRTCCYDRAGQREAEKRGEKTKGNAVHMAARMGIDLLTENEYRKLQEQGKFDLSSWSWLKTPSGRRKAGVALLGHRSFDGVYVFERDPNYFDDIRAFRCSLRV